MAMCTSGHSSGRAAVRIGVITALASMARVGVGQCPLFFHVPDRLTVGNNPLAMAAADLNRDGATDILVLEDYPGPKRLRTYLGRGDGMFTAAGSFTPVTNSLIIKVMLAEVTGDGIVDAVLLHRNDGTIEVRPGRGDGTFRDRGDDGRFDAGAWRNDAAVADVDGDGRPDLIGVEYYTGQVTVLLNAGGGNFGPPVRTAVGASPIAVAAGDLTGDGRAELIVQLQSPLAGQLRVLRSTGGGAFTPMPGLPLADPCGQVFAAVRDVNSDGRNDVVVASCSLLQTFLGTAGGLVAGPTQGLTSQGNLVEPVYADINGDGKLDAVLPGRLPRVMAGLGNGAFAPGEALSPVFADGAAGSVYAIFAADVDADGRPDIGSLYNGDALAPGSMALHLNRGRQPTIIGAPVMPPVVEGASIVLTVAATGPMRSYQWLRDGVSLADGGRYQGTRSMTLRVDGLTQADAAAGFACRVSTDCGAVISGAATVVVTPSCPSDFNGDGFVDFFDYDDFVVEFEAGC